MEKKDIFTICENTPFREIKIAGEHMILQKHIAGWRAFLAPVKGRIIWNLNSILWYIRNFHNLKSTILEEQNISITKPYLMQNWHLGWRYFLGEDKERKTYFIKYGEETAQLKMEILSLQKMKEIGSLHVPMLAGHALNDKYGYIIQENIEGEVLRREHINQKDTFFLDKLIKEFIEISSELKAAGIIHRDVRPENLMFCKQNQKIVLIDFATCVMLLEGHFKSALTEERYLEGLGGEFKSMPFVWDDVYSFCKIAKYVDVEADERPLWRELKCQEGKFTYRYERMKEKNGNE